MITLTKEQVLLLHGRLIEVTGGVKASVTKECWNLPYSIHFNLLEEKNCIRVFRQRRRSYAMVL